MSEQDTGREIERWRIEVCEACGTGGEDDCNCPPGTYDSEVEVVRASCLDEAEQQLAEAREGRERIWGELQRLRDETDMDPLHRPRDLSMVADDLEAALLSPPQDPDPSSVQEHQWGPGDQSDFDRAEELIAEGKLPDCQEDERCGGTGVIWETAPAVAPEYPCPGCPDCQPATDPVRGRPETGWTCKGSGQFSYLHLIQLSGPAVGGPFPCPGCPDCQEKCERCGGSGSFPHLVPCPACHGTGEKPKGEGR